MINTTWASEKFFCRVYNSKQRDVAQNHRLNFRKEKQEKRNITRSNEENPFHVIEARIMVDNRSWIKAFDLSRVRREQAEPIAQNGLRFKIRNTPRYNMVLWSQRKDKRAHGGREGATTRRGRRGRARWHASFSPLPMRIGKVERVYAISPSLVAVFHGVTHRRSRRKIPRICDPVSAWPRANWLPTLSSLLFFVSPELFANNFFDRSIRIRLEFCRIFFRDWSILRYLE